MPIFTQISNYYVEMPYNPSTPTNNHEDDQLVVNLEDHTPELNNLIGLNQILQVIGLVKLLCLQ
jgi:hypothetical protein